MFCLKRYRPKQIHIFQVSLLLMFTFLMPGCAMNSTLPEQKDQIVNTMNARREAYYRCFASNTALSGKATYSWVVLKEGNVANVKLEDSSFKNPAVEQCISNVIATTQFPAQPEALQLKYPFSYNAEK